MPDQTLQRQYVLDAGALLEQERHDRKMVALLEVAARHRIEMILPAVVLAQVWRDGARQARLTHALHNPGLVEAPLHHEDAGRVGELLGESATTDVVDAHVAVIAARLRAPVITSDPADLSRLGAGIELIPV